MSIKPGTFPPDMLDQPQYWIAPDGNTYTIKNLDEPSILWALDYALANAQKIRTHYSIERLEVYDETERPRRWMLDRVVVRALMRRLIELENEKKEKQAEMAKNNRYLTPGVEAAIKRMFG